jgi:hypothetical protein
MLVLTGADLRRGSLSLEWWNRDVATSVDVPRASGEPGSPIVIICTLVCGKSNQSFLIFLPVIFLRFCFGVR